MESNSIADDTTPEWKIRLFAVPEKDRCGAHKDLVRAVQSFKCLKIQLQASPLVLWGTPLALKALIAAEEALYLKIGKMHLCDVLLQSDRDIFDVFRRVIGTWSLIGV